MKSIHTLAIAAAAALATIATGCDKKKEATVDSPVRVTTQVVESVDVANARTYSGTVTESEGSVVSFGVPGTLQSIKVSEGDYVKAGQLIATIDASNLRNAYDMAAATTAQAEDAYNRMKQLHDSGSLPDMKWVEVENTYKAAQSAEAIARKALNDANLYAPFTGYVSQKFADAGTTVAPGVPVVKIVKINPVKVNVSVPEGEIGNFNVGSKCSLSVGALAGRTFEGTLTEKGVAANPITRAYDLKFTIDNTDGALLPGMICDVNIATDGSASSAPQAIVLAPSTVLLDADNYNFVWTVKDGKAAKRIVKVDAYTDRGLVISDGLAAGDSVIVAGQQKVSTGTAVVAVD